MTTEPPTLSAFLLARIAERRARADSVHDRECYLFVPEHMQMDPPECDCGEPARVLAECEAKRRIVGLHEEDEVGGGLHVCHDELVDESECGELRALAAVYADHPAFREEWRP